MRLLDGIDRCIVKAQMLYQQPVDRDPEIGATWSGLARVPAWIAGVDDRTPFLINGAG
ncbi:hypothetical protein SAMN02787142_7658 [Burkholderia sp. WP9]|nr:hypothetical protein SAMN02787142_7658 [Burkholderia sp. WP9]